MVSVRKRGKVYEYRFETGMVDGKSNGKLYSAKLHIGGNFGIHRTNSTRKM